ncbi:LPXTG cell wall anchor domain-containing protein [Clostridium disporicum]
MNNTQNPNTGDQSNILNWALAVLISLIGLLFVNRKRKKVK